MKEAVRWWLVHSLHWALLYASFGLNVDGALYVVKFFTWALALVGLFMLTAASVADAASRPPRKWVSYELAWLQAWVTLVLLVWHGHFASGVAWGLVMSVSAVKNEKVSKLRSEKAA